jgi:hypothetical protein
MARDTGLNMDTDSEAETSIDDESDTSCHIIRSHPLALEDMNGRRMRVLRVTCGRQEATVM